MTRASSAQQAAHVRLLLDSYQHYLGAELMARSANADENARRLYEAPIVVLSHGAEADPVLNYANAAALALWDTTADDFIGLPSRLTAEPHNREARAVALAQSMQKGFATGYAGVRISRTGSRFMIEGATLWTVRDDAGRAAGQAAAFAHWAYL